MRNEQRKSALLTLLVVGLVSLFAVGCGSSDDFVANSNSNPTNAPTAGNLIFQFVQAQQLETVPIGTTTLRFDFFSDSTPSAAFFLFTETRSFAELIIIRDVPPNVHSVVVTAFDALGEPIAVFTGQVNVVIGADSDVDLVFNSSPSFESLTLSPSPAIILSPTANTSQVTVTGSFDTSQVFGQRTSYDVDIPPANCQFNFVEFSGNSGATANITSDGLVTGLAYAQNSTLNCEYEVLGTSMTESVLVRACRLFAASNQPLTLTSTDSYTAGYSVTFHDSDGTLVVVNSNATSNATFATKPSTISGVVVDKATGDITTNGAAEGNYKLVVSWQDPRTQNADGTGGTNTTFSTNLTFSVVPNI